MSKQSAAPITDKPEQASVPKRSIRTASNLAEMRLAIVGKTTAQVLTAVLASRPERQKLALEALALRKAEKAEKRAVRLAAAAA